MSEMREELLNESRRELVDILQAEITADERITFARFMELALSHPQYGYYQHRNSPTGFTGDFLTAPETHPIFGHALARQIAECWDRLGQPTTFTTREYGSGRGTLAHTILEGLEIERPDTLAALTYELSDVNEQQVRQALTLLQENRYGAHARRATDEPITGVALANELLDAFPVHRLVFQHGEMLEVYVTWRDGWFADDTGPVSDSRLLLPFEGLTLTDGQRMEVSPPARQWAQSIGDSIERGYSLLIDYGYPARDLYDPAQRHSGTLRTYSQHLVSDDPFRRVGMQDLTAHVDFTAIASAAESSGCQVLGLTSQAYFFAGLGIEEILLRLQATATSAHDYLNAREALMHLLDPRGLGRFRVLALGKGVPSSPALRGLSFVLR